MRARLRRTLGKEKRSQEVKVRGWSEYLVKKSMRMRFGGVPITVAVPPTLAE